VHILFIDSSGPGLLRDKLRIKQLAVEGKVQVKPPDESNFQNEM
jgi:hypothetical protein